jgi:hypothetical protein
MTLLDGTVLVFGTAEEAGAYAHGWNSLVAGACGIAMSPPPISPNLLAAYNFGRHAHELAGDARPATESEALAAARGVRRRSSIHELKFAD